MKIKDIRDINAIAAFSDLKAGVDLIGNLLEDCKAAADQMEDAGMKNGAKRLRTGMMLVKALYESGGIHCEEIEE